MTHPRTSAPRPLARWVTAVCGALVVSAAATACGSGGDGIGEVADRRADPTRGVVPTIPGGVELGSLDPATVLTGADLAFGAPLPSEQAAADAFAEQPEFVSALARRVFHRGDGRRLADALVLVVDGSAIFDEEALSALVHAAVGAIGRGVARAERIGAQDVIRAQASDGTHVAVGFLSADVLTVVSGSSDAEVTLTVTRQIEARARGEIGSATPTTPLVPVEPDSVFVAVPTVAFEEIPGPEDEAVPEPPSMVGASAVTGRFGVAAGERRTTVWVVSTSRSTYPWAEALEPAMEALAMARANGSAPTPTEFGGRVVYQSVNAPGTPSAHVFRHHGLVLLVEGDQADQVAAVATAWIAALGPT
ncbi:MAG: hypothetical protein ACT452_04900 [Microthrixaceae bacterium]